MKNVTLVILLVVLTSCAVVQAWTTPQPVVNGINTANSEFISFLSNDGKTLYFTRDEGNCNIYQATRQGTSGPFSSVTKALDHGSVSDVIGPWVSADNLRMYYYNEGGTWKLRVSTRNSVSDPWTEGNIISGFGSFSSPQLPRLSQDELTLVFDAYNASGGMGGYDLWIATRLNTSSPFGNIRNLSELNSTGFDGGQYLSPDGLTIYFSSDRSGINQIFKATRQFSNDTFGNLEHLSFFDSTYGSSMPSLSSNGSTFFFTKIMADSSGDIYYSQVPEPATLLLLTIGVVMMRKNKE